MKWYEDCSNFYSIDSNIYRNFEPLEIFYFQMKLVERNDRYKYLFKCAFSRVTSSNINYFLKSLKTSGNGHLSDKIIQLQTD